MAVFPQACTKFDEQAATPRGDITDGWDNDTDDCYVTYDNGNGIDINRIDPSQQRGYLKLVGNAGADTNVLRAGSATYDPRLTTGNGGANHLIAVRFRPSGVGNSTDLLRVSVGHDVANGNYFGVFVDRGGNQVGIWRMDGFTAFTAGTWYSAGGNLSANSHYWAVAFTTSSGNNYRFNAYVANYATPATPFTNGAAWGGPADAASAAHVGLLPHGVGIRSSWPNWTGGIYEIRSWINVPHNALSAGFVWFDSENSTNTQIVMKAFRPTWGTEPYTTTTWYRHTDVGTATSSPSSGTAVTGTLDACTDATALSGVTYWYVRKVTDNSSTVAYSEPVAARLHRVAPQRILLIGTSEWANAQLGGPYHGAALGADGTGGSHGTGGSILERKLRRMLSCPCHVSNQGVAGSTWNSWATGLAATAITNVTGLSGGNPTAAIVDLGENDVQSASPLADAQTVIGQIRTAFPTIPIFVAPPVFSVPGAVSTAAQIQNVINNWRAVRAGLSGVRFIANSWQDDFATRQMQELGGDLSHVDLRGMDSWTDQVAAGFAGVLDGTATSTSKLGSTTGNLFYTGD